MCSICGIIDFKNNENINRKIVEEMGNVLTHRGPDQNGSYISNQVAFWHNRLAIMDIEHGLQPMTIYYQGYRYTIIYNGEIYNTIELKKEIEKQGVVFETECDTEVVLYAYILFGSECSSKLNGIFAYAIYDERKQQVYLSRDRFGIKPFFYAEVGSTFIFASEVKAILKFPKMKAEVDQIGLWQLFYLTPVKINGTSVFKNIKEIPPATHGIFSEKGFLVEKYWTLKAKENRQQEKDIIEETGYILKDAIVRQLVSDVPLCTFLSGGLDSSIISAVASQEYKKKNMQLSTYSFEHEKNNLYFKNTSFQPESDDEYARYLADYLGTNHQVLTATVEDTVGLLYNAVKYRDLPGMADVDSSLLYYCQQVKKENTVALSGECSDEIFGGYPWFYKEEMQHTGFFPWIHNPHVRANLFKEEFTQKEEGFQYLKGIYEGSIRECPILDTDSKIMRESRYATWLSVQYFMTSLLERKDRMSMGTGVEVRVPFADHRILEYIYNVPWEIKFKGRVEKYLLREAMKEYLPDKILNRKKSPYPKTHNPEYEKKVTALVLEKLNNPSSILHELLNKEALEALLQGNNSTWFGQLMSKPQLLGWLVQVDYWFDNYKVNIVK